MGALKNLRLANHLFGRPANSPLQQQGYRAEPLHQSLVARCDRRDESGTWPVLRPSVVHSLGTVPCELPLFLHRLKYCAETNDDAVVDATTYARTFRHGMASLSSREGLRGNQGIMVDTIASTN
jgi:hypothetical protein